MLAGWKSHSPSGAPANKVLCAESAFPCIVKKWPISSTDPAAIVYDGTLANSSLSSDVSGACTHSTRQPSCPKEREPDSGSSCDGLTTLRKPASGLSAALKAIPVPNTSHGPRLSVQVPSRSNAPSTDGAAPSDAGRPPLPPQPPPPPPSKCLGRGCTGHASGASNTGNAAAPKAEAGAKAAAGDSAASSVVSDGTTWNTWTFFSPSVVDRLWAGHASPASSLLQPPSHTAAAAPPRRDQAVLRCQVHVQQAQVQPSAQQPGTHHHQAQQLHQQEQQPSKKKKVQRDGAWFSFSGLGGKDVVPASGRAANADACCCADSDESSCCYGFNTATDSTTADLTTGALPAAAQRCEPVAPGAASAAAAAAAPAPCMSLVAAAAAAAPAPMALGSACTQIAAECGCGACSCGGAGAVCGGGSYRLGQWGSGVVGCKALAAESAMSAASAPRAATGMAPPQVVAAVGVTAAAAAPGIAQRLPDDEAAGPCARTGFVLEALAPCDATAPASAAAAAAAAAAAEAPSLYGLPSPYTLECVRGTLHSGPRMPLGDGGPPQHRELHTGRVCSQLRQQLQQQRLQQEQQEHFAQWLAAGTGAHPSGGGAGAGAAYGNGCGSAGVVDDGGSTSGVGGGPEPDSPLSQASTVWEHPAAPGPYAPDVSSGRCRGSDAALDARTRWWGATGLFADSDSAALRHQQSPCEHEAGEPLSGREPGRRRGVPWWRLLGFRL